MPAREVGREIVRLTRKRKTRQVCGNTYLFIIHHGMKRNQEASGAGAGSFCLVVVFLTERARERGKHARRRGAD